MPKKQPLKTRPHLWKSGPDPVAHQKYLAWLQHRAQAQFRNEVYELDFASWLEVWQQHWHQRGRTRNSVCITRQDPEQSWCLENVQVVTREQHARRQGEWRRNRGR